MTFTKDELETHVWYDPVNDETWIESNLKRHITKILKSGWTVVSKTMDGDRVTAIQAKRKGFGVSIRNCKNKAENDE